LQVILLGWLCAVLIGAVHGVTHFSMDPLSSLGNSVFLSLLGALAGPFVGLLNTGPYFRWTFKLALALALILAAVLIVVGTSGKAMWWRWLLGIAGVILWITAGLIGFGPQ
jgi:hypothetical protein